LHGTVGWVCAKMIVYVLNKNGRYMVITKDASVKLISFNQFGI